MTITHFKPGSHVQRKCKRKQNTRVNYIKANANASANARNEKCFISLRLYLRMRLHFTCMNRVKLNEPRQRKGKCKHKDKKKTGFIGSMPPQRSKVKSKMASSILEEKLVESVQKYRVPGAGSCGCFINLVQINWKNSCLKRCGKRIGTKKPCHCVLR